MNYCVILGNTLSLSDPQFPIYKMQRFKWTILKSLIFYDATEILALIMVDVSAEAFGILKQLSNLEMGTV